MISENVPSLKQKSSHTQFGRKLKTFWPNSKNDFNDRRSQTVLSALEPRPRGVTVFCVVSKPHTG